VGGHDFGGFTLRASPFIAESGGGGGMDTGRPDPKRLMRVSAEMANLPDLAVFWDSSILVRTDEGSMDLMRAYIVGPPGTPYEGGWFGFDIKLTPAYPDEPPKVSSRMHTLHVARAVASALSRCSTETRRSAALRRLSSSPRVEAPCDSTPICECAVAWGTQRVVAPPLTPIPSW